MPRIPRLDYELQLARCLEIIRWSGGCSVRTLSKAMGRPQTTIKKWVGRLRMDGLIDYTTDQEEPESRCGQRPWILRVTEQPGEEAAP